MPASVVTPSESEPSKTEQELQVEEDYPTRIPFALIWTSMILSVLPPALDRTIIAPAMYYLNPERSNLDHA
jgi:hypothetical protein